MCCMHFKTEVKIELFLWCSVESENILALVPFRHLAQVPCPHANIAMAENTHGKHRRLVCLAQTDSRSTINLSGAGNPGHLLTSAEDSKGTLLMEARWAMAKRASEQSQAEDESINTPSKKQRQDIPTEEYSLVAALQQLFHCAGDTTRAELQQAVGQARASLIDRME